MSIEIKFPAELSDCTVCQDVVVQKAMLLYPFINRSVISYGQAADMIGMNKLDLIALYGDFGIPYFTEDDEAFETDLHTLKSLCRT